jgi:cytochrome bd ubiquinol oxidase subunit II
MHGLWNLQTLWFVLVCVLWIGFMFLEGFDFGVGMLLRFVGKTPEERRAVIHTIGPVWDGNEVWLLTAGGATFAAFPNWYASMFSGFYLALFLVLFGLIIRGVSFEFWGKVENPQWRSVWEWAMAVGSFLPALLVGVAFANLIRGISLDQAGNYTGSFWDLLNPYALLGGVVTLLLCLAHGASFLQLRTVEPIKARAAALGRILLPLAAIAVIGFVLWTFGEVSHHSPGLWITMTVAIVAMVAMAALGAMGRVGLAFIAGGLGIAMTVATWFTALYPNVIVDSNDHAYNLTVFNSASNHYTLVVMTITALILVPIVLIYQIWTYYVFRQRVGLGGSSAAPTTPEAPAPPPEASAQV